MNKEQEFRKQTEEAKFEAFSLMCKKVADLEAKLKHAEENCINKTCVVLKDKEDCVAKLLELEKENAELKLKLEALEGQTPWKDIKDKSEVIRQLTKAKEIIRELLNYDIILIDITRKFEYMDLQKKAEAFLNSEVEK